MENLFFAYGRQETDYLSRDKRLGEAIRQLGFVKRPVNPDIFQSLVYQIIGQQISTKANQTIWDRMVAGVGTITPRVISDLSPEALQQYGLSWRKVGYIQGIADRVCNGSLQLDELPAKSDSEVCRILSSLPGIGKWTAEMLMLHSMQRSDILSWDDLAIIRGMRMLYRHRKIDRKLFERYRRRYSPYGSVASIYLWQISAGGIPGLTDPAERRDSQRGA
jgi:DNA-3-methyladenine glycosylase II